MAWLVGGAITLSATKQNLGTSVTPNVGLVKAVRFFHDPANTHIAYYGDTNINVVASPKAGLLGWIPPPNSTPASITTFEDWTVEFDAPNGINLEQVFVIGTASEILYWSYITQ